MSPRILARSALLVAAMGVLLARAEDPKSAPEDVAKLEPFLKRGELLLVEPAPEGGLSDMTAMASVSAPIRAAWETLLDYESYSRWVPRVVKSRIDRKDGKTFDVFHEVDVPGTNLKYAIRFETDEEKHTIDGKWLSGDLGGGHWTWHLHAQGDSKTVIVYTQETDPSAQSRILRALDDPNKTLSSGLGLASVYLMAKSAKHEIERRASEKPSRFR